MQPLPQPKPAPVSDPQQPEKRPVKMPRMPWKRKKAA